MPHVNNVHVGLTNNKDYKGCDGSESDPQNFLEQDAAGQPLDLRQRLYRHKGALCVLLAALLFSIENVFYRYIENDIHNTEVLFLTYLLKVCFVLPVITYKGYALRPAKKKTYILLIGRGLLGLISLNACFYAFRYIKVGDATAIVLSVPVFVGIFAKLFLKEAFGIIDALLTLVVVAGVFLISKPSFLFGGNEEEALSNLIGSAFASFSCISLAMTNIINRKLGLIHVNSVVNFMYFVVVGSVGTGVLTSVAGDWSMPPCGSARMVVVTMGILGCSGQWLITYAFSIEKSVLLAIVQTNEIIFAYLLEFLLFGVSPDLIALSGVCLVVFASLASSIKKRNTSEH